MLNQRARETAYFEATLDGLLLSLAFASAFTIRSLVPMDFLGPHRVPSFSAHFWLLSIGIPLFWILAGRSGLYDRSRCRSVADLLGAMARPFLSMSLLLGTAIFLFQAKTFSRAVFFMFLLIGFALILVGLAMVSVLTAFVAAWFVGPETKEEQADLEEIRQEVREIKEMLKSLLPGYLSNIKFYFSLFTGTAGDGKGKRCKEGLDKPPSVQ